MNDDETLLGLDLGPMAAGPAVTEHGTVVADPSDPRSPDITYEVRSDATVKLEIKDRWGVPLATVVMTRDAWGLLKAYVDRAWP